MSPPTGSSTHFAASPPPVAGRMLPDEEVNSSTGSKLQSLRLKLRQKTLFEYGLPTEGPKHERGLPKDKAEFKSPSQHSVPWGDPVCSNDEVRDNGIFRLVSHNVNGLSSANDHSDVIHMATAMKNKDVALFGLQETNRNFERQSMVESFHRVIRSTSTHHHGVVSSAKLQWPQDYQPGGTAVSIRNKWATRFLSKGNDVYGRWSWITLAGRGTKKITFISSYRVCDGAKEAPITSRTVRAQQEWMYADRGFSSVNLREQFATDIITLVNEIQQNGHEVVIMMDANEGSGFGSAVDKIRYECNLADVHALAGKTNPPPTYQRGTEKIDFVLISASLVCSVRAASILALHDGYLSDHRALLVDFDANSLFSSATSEILPAAERRLTSTNPRAVHSYITTMKQHVTKHNLLHKIQRLQRLSDNNQWSDACIQEWETIDKLLSEARMASERKCKAKRTGQLPWSPALQKSGRTLLYWRLRLREFTSNNVNKRMCDQLAVQLQLSATERNQQSSLSI